MLNHTTEGLLLPQLILASGSPRRAEILNSVGWGFTKDIPDVDESVIDGESPEAYVQRLALEKARAVAERHADSLILAADTTVVLDGEIIGKPVDLDDARRMITALSGNSHEVLTGVAVISGTTETVGMQRTIVNFASLNEAEIEMLVQRGEPMDKAGAYAVQAQAALFIEGIDGDYWNVVGLPISLVYCLVRDTLKNNSEAS